MSSTVTPTTADVSQLRRGRRIVLFAAAGGLFLNGLMVAWQTYQGLFRAALVGRTVIYLFVCWQMYRGRAWARVVFLILMLAGTVNFGLLVAQDWFQLVYALAYAGLGATILLSPDARAHFR